MSISNEKIIDIAAHVICRDVMYYRCKECPLHKCGTGVDTDFKYCCHWCNLTVPIEIVQKAEDLLTAEQYEIYVRKCKRAGYNPNLNRVEFI